MCRTRSSFAQLVKTADKIQDQHRGMHLVRVDNVLSDWFASKSGRRESYTLSYAPVGQNVSHTLPRLVESGLTTRSPHVLCYRLCTEICFRQRNQVACAAELIYTTHSRFGPIDPIGLGLL